MKRGPVASSISMAESRTSHAPLSELPKAFYLLLLAQFLWFDHPKRLTARKSFAGLESCLVVRYRLEQDKP
jgi:hypothetical protein